MRRSWQGAGAELTQSPSGLRSLLFGTEIGKHGHKRIEAMLTSNHYLELKRQARRLMLSGDVERYMRVLRELSMLRLRFPTA